MENIINQLFLMMEYEKPYLSNSFSRRSFSKKLGIDQKTIDDILKDYFGLSAYEFISLYRINNAQLLIHKGYSIVECYKFSGFKSKRGLFKAFDCIVI